MKISACYIVKNEEKVLSRSIASLKEQVDEIIVVDTGSTDKTKAVAEKFVVRMFNFDWVDDFAAARNFAISKATGDYIVFLDADEYFSAETAANLRQAVESRKDAEAVAVDLLNIDSDTGEKQGDFFALRAFRRQADIKYFGKIHEQLGREDKKQLVLSFVPPAELLILHTGYSTNISRQKAERNLAMLQKEYGSTTDKERLYMYLADAYFGLENKAEAKKWALLDINSGRKQVSMASRSYRILLQYLAVDKASVDERLHLTRRAVTDFPEVPEFWAEYAEALAAVLEYDKAVSAGTKALEKSREPRGLEPWQFNTENADLLRERLEYWQKIIQQMAEIKISACLIARNDERDAAKWLENAQQFADEIIYVDTGAVDGTPQLFKERGITDCRFSWQDDFAAARNFAISKATGDWIVFTDADELFLQPERIRPYLAERVLKNDAEAVQVTIINIDEDDNDREIQRFPAIRLFKRQNDIGYFGAIHETLQKASGALQVISETTRLFVKHTGYSGKRIMQKLQRNLALLEAEIAQTGIQPRHHHYLAQCYLGMKRYDEALKEALTALTTEGASTVGSDSDMYFTALLSMKQLKKSVAEQQLLLETAVAAFPDLPDFWAELGLLLLETEKDRATDYLQRAINLFENPANQAATRFSNLADRVYLAVAGEYFGKGDNILAEKLCYQALKFNCFYEKALDLWFRLAADKPAAVQKLAELYRSSQQREFLLYYCQKREMWTMCEEIAGQLSAEKGFQDELADFYQLRQSGDFSALYKKIVQKLSIDVQVLFALLVKLTVNGEKLEFAEQTAKQLPEALTRIIAKLQGNIQELAQEDFSVFQAFLPVLSRYLEETELIQGLRAVENAPESVLTTMAGKLAELEQWPAAFYLYQQLPADSQLINGEFWYQVGRCLYNLRDFDAAEEAFARAKKMGTEKRDIAVYLTWMEEGKINE